MSEFPQYNYTNVTIFCAAFKYLDPYARQVSRVYLDGISTFKCKMTTGIIDLVNQLLQTDKCKKIAATKTKLEFRFDNASTFIWEQFAYYVLCEMQNLFQNMK